MMRPPILSRRDWLALSTGTALAHLLPVFDAAAAPLTYTLKPKQLPDGIWMIAGAPEAITFENGGAIANIVIIDTPEGAVVVDTGPSKRYGEQLAAIAKNLTGKPVIRVYITHFHPDHAFGNQAFAAESIAAPQGVIDGLKAMGNDFSDAMYRIAGDWMRGTEVVLPTRATADGIEDIGGRKLRLLNLKGHTASDLAIFDEQSGQLIAGDLVFLDRAPTTPQANLAQWRESLQQLTNLKHERLIPGHGPAEENTRGLVQTKDWLDALEERISSAFERGLDMNEAMAEPLPAWMERIALARYEYQRSIMHFFPQLEAARLPSVGKRE